MLIGSIGSLRGGAPNIAMVRSDEGGSGADRAGALGAPDAALAAKSVAAPASAEDATPFAPTFDEIAGILYGDRATAPSSPS